MQIQDLISVDNIADYLDDDHLNDIGRLVKQQFDIDEASRAEWKEKSRDAMDLAMQVSATKNYPWEGASNVVYPLLTTAALQFAARAYPAIVPDTNVVKARVVGRDPEGTKAATATRVSQHMSWQLLEEMEEWDEQTDKMLIHLPIVGMAYRKVYFDPVVGRNVSEFVSAMDLVVNDKTPSMARAPRASQIFTLYPHEVTERQRAGIYREVDIGSPQDSGADEDAPHTFYEQHRWLDLDEDGYPEPYVVTIHSQSTKVLRIRARFDAEGITINKNTGNIARIEPNQYYVKYGFIPNPDGGFHDIGFGFLLHGINQAVNTSLNQMMDAGHLQNTGGGFIARDLRMKGGNLRFRPGEYKMVNTTGSSIRDSVVNLDFKGPSPVLFSLLGLLIDSGKDVSAVKDVLLGEMPAGTTATGALSMVEQGTKQFTAIYKRVHRSFKQELKLLFNLNAKYMPPELYFTLLDDPQAIWQKDYDPESLDVIPVSDPRMTSDTQKMAKAQLLMELESRSTINSQSVLLRVLEAANIEEPESLILDEAPVDPKMAQIQGKLENDRARIMISADKTEAEILKMRIEALKLVAETEDIEVGANIRGYEQQLAEIENELQRVEGEPGHQGGVPVPQGPPSGNAKPVGDGQLAG